MIYITGDCHGCVERFSVDVFPEQKEMTKDDYVIICGDFGIIWNYKGESSKEKYWLDWLNDKPFTTLFIDGNHENFDRLNSYPVEYWNGGRIHRIRDSVYHLIRGEVFSLQEKKFFTFGGASSHDIKDGILEPEDKRIKEWNKDMSKLFRVNHRTWWKEELPGEEEMDKGDYNLKVHNNKVDFIITHSPPASIVALLGRGRYEQDNLTMYLEDVRTRVDYVRWFFGHMHIDWQINERDIGLYYQIVRIV